jgi:hypothetical protein
VRDEDPTYKVKIQRLDPNAGELGESYRQDLGRELRNADEE